VSWRLITRVDGRVRKQDFATGDEALAALEQECRAVASNSRRESIKVAKRTYEPIVQVQARAELRGPGRAAGGVDVRGDGSTEAFTGRIRRRLVEAERGESAYAALRRALGSSVSVDP
jgi:hypothetical protein